MCFSSFVSSIFFFLMFCFCIHSVQEKNKTKQMNCVRAQSQNTIFLFCFKLCFVLCSWSIRNSSHSMKVCYGGVQVHLIFFSLHSTRTFCFVLSKCDTLEIQKECNKFAMLICYDGSIFIVTYRISCKRCERAHTERKKKKEWEKHDW